MLRYCPKIPGWEAVIRRWLVKLFTVFVLTGALAGCGGGGSSSPTPTPSPTVTASASPTPTPTPTANTATVILDGGPSALSTGKNGYTAFNEPYVTVTLCAPGSTTNCQTIEHVILDTGSVGLRVLQPVLNASLLAALPEETDSSGNAVGECYQYVSSYAFGSVRLANFQIAGETVANMPIQVIADTGAFSNVPNSCSSGGGTNTATIQDLGANAIIGIGSTAPDCGTLCQAAGTNAGAIYYDCPTSGCATTIARTAATTAPFEQLPNPVAAFASDNNGTIITLPAVAQAGVATLTGSITFGIGTQTNNSLNAANVLELTTSTSRSGPGLVTATYNGKTLPYSYFDTGSSVYYFIDNTITVCTQGVWENFYCPTSSLALSPTAAGTNNVTASGAFTLYNPTSLAGTVTVAPGLGIDTASIGEQSENETFAFGIPFYFGRTVYTAIEGTTAGGVAGPYVAF